MIVKANVHLGFNCRDLEKSVKFYKEILGCKEKFTVYYGDLIPKEPERLSKIPENILEEWKSHKDVKWFVYLEWLDGYFIELFNIYKAHVYHPVDSEQDFGFTHFAFVVDDVQKFYEDLLEKGAEEYIDRVPEPALDGNRNIWIHDPDGNRIEVQEYTKDSMQLGGNGYR